MPCYEYSGIGAVPSMKLVLIPGLDGTADLFADFMKALVMYD